MFGLVFGSVIKLFVSIVKGFIGVVSWCVIYLGLWVPALYVAAGVVLYFTVHFNPFEWTALGQLYFAGLVASGVLAVIITIRTLVVKPLRSFSEGYKNPFGKKSKDKKDAADASRKDEYRDEALPTPRRDAPTANPSAQEPPYSPYRREQPLIYESELEQGAIIYEYNDRFEVFVKRNGRLILDKVEMKNEDE